MAHEARTDFSMLLGGIFLLINGAGKYSLDYLIYRKSTNENKRINTEI